MLAVAFGAHVALFNCATNPLTPDTSAANANDPAVAAAQAVTNDLFSQEAPAVNAAIAKLPPEAQGLAQTAYIALEQSILVAEQKGILALNPAAHADAVAALQNLSNVSDALHAALHEPDARAPSIVADPGSVAADPNQAVNSAH